MVFVRALSRHTPPAASALLGIILLLSACSGLGGEPRIVATFPPATPAPTQIGFPVSPPDLALGAQLYAQNCTRCHGISGQGDGVLVGAGPDQIPGPLPSFTDPATSAQQTPLAWFATITDGRIEKLMPPWREALTESERWSVALYTYTLHYRAEQIALGQSLWQSQRPTPPELPPPSRQVNLTDSALLNQVAESAGLSPFIASLSETERAALAAYVRTQGLANADGIGRPIVAEPLTTAEPLAAVPATTPEPAAVVSGSATISGRVTNGTAGGPVPADLILTLHVFDAEFNDTPLELPINADGTFSFTGLALQPDRTYMVTTIYQDRLFGSRGVPGDPAQPALNLPVTIYERTADPSVIQINGIVSQIVAVEDKLQIAQVLRISNTSDRIYSTDQSFGGSVFGSVSIPLPAGAQLLNFDDQGRYAVSDDGAAITDTRPVVPGDEHIVHLVYALPYGGDLEVQQMLPYAVAGPVRLLVTPESLRVASDRLGALGPEIMRSVTYQSYGADLTLPAGSIISYRLSGTADSGGRPLVLSSDQLVPVLLIAVGLTAIGFAVFLILRERRQPEPASAAPGSTKLLMDGLIQQIAELDDQYARKTVDQVTYTKRRAKLKARLTELMDKE